MSESTEPGEKDVWRLKTDGVNLEVLWRHADILNLKQAYTNNIHAMANAYGLEAACKTIIKVRGDISASTKTILRLCTKIVGKCGSRYLYL